MIAVSSSGDVMLSDEDLKVTSSVAAEPHSVLLKSFVIGQDECTFLSHNRGQHRAVVVLCFTMVASHVKLRIVMAYSTGELEEVSECDMGVYEVNIARLYLGSSLSFKNTWRMSMIFLVIRLVT